MKIMQERLLTWFQKNRRPFNFRQNRNPYRVWVAEVMLQQTRAQVVQSYFREFMNKWPTLEKLSLANEGEVIKAFEGLGYYSRAKRLLLGAKEIMNKFGGQIPNDRQELMSISGIGSYTAGAILSFAFNQNAVALDGNVMRVMARLIGYKGVIKGKHVMDMLFDETKKWIDHEQGSVLMEALIELGASQCSKRALCFECPLNKGCCANIMGLTDIIPLMPERKKTKKIFRCVALIEYKNKFVIQQVQEGRVMSSLYEFCYQEHVSKNHCYQEQGSFEERFLCKLDLVEILKEETHSFTHFHATLIPKHFKAKSKPKAPLKSIEEIENIALSSGHKRIFQKLLASRV